MRYAKRLERLKPYPFARQAEKIAQLKARGVDVIRMDIGSPDQPPAPHIIRALEKAAVQAESHAYPAFTYGSPLFLHAAADYYRERFQVALDPRREVTALIGSKEGIFHMQQIILEEGDVALVPDPGYPVYRIAAEWAGAEVWPMPLRAERDFLPDLGSIPDGILRRAKILWINYPNNPTGATADPDFYEEVVDFAKRHDLLVCHDAAYCDVAFDGYRPSSILQVPGAKEVAVEFSSLSKTYNMAGWRLGMLAGASEAVGALRRAKSNVDSGIFPAVLSAGEAALTGSQDWIRARNELYATRRDVILRGLQAIGIQARKPLASLYIWARIPAGRLSEEFADEILGSDRGVLLARYFLRRGGRGLYPDFAGDRLRARRRGDGEIGRMERRSAEGPFPRENDARISRPSRS
jgi:LL-diaminopimelate aminotransferase